MDVQRLAWLPMRAAGFVIAAMVAMVSSAQPAAKGSPPGKVNHMQITSRDGTRITFEKQGTGPALVIVGGALSDRTGGADLARLLAPHLTVYSHDRRGRGGSGDPKPYSLGREIEDLEALIDHAGGTAFIYGKSSGGALALQATSELGSKVKRLALYEVPYDDSEGAAQKWRAFRAQLDSLLAAGRSAEAIEFFLKFSGAPDEVLAKMKASPAWPAMLALAPTLANDSAVLGDDRAVPVAVAARIKSPTLVIDGSASAKPMPFMRATADTLGRTIPGAQRQTLEG